MEVVEGLVKTTLGEIEKVLSTKTVVGEPITIEGKTIVPLISVGFGFGAGGGTGKGGEASRQQGEGTGGGSGGGAGIKPVAVIIISGEDVRVEPIVGGVAGALEKVGESIPRMVEKVIDRRQERKKEG